MLYTTNPFHRKNLIEIQTKRPPKRQPWNIDQKNRNQCSIPCPRQRSDVILFFDEADALFGKRSKINDEKEKETK